MKKLEIKTKRIIISPMSEEEIGTLMEHAGSDKLRTAYGKMLDSCKRDPENRIWYAPWKMTRKDSGKSIGDLWFRGPVKNHSVEIGYTEHEDSDSGCISEALRAMTQWAFQQKEVVFIEAGADPDNKAFQHALETCGFVPDGEKRHFILESPLTNWTSIYMLFGMSIGQLNNQMLWGMAIGISLGVLVGILLDRSAKKSRETLRWQRESHT